MSTALIPNEGKLRLLDMLTGGLGFTNVRIKLIRADFTLAATVVYADLSYANFSGYADATPVYGSAAVVSGKAKMIDSQRTFSHSGGATANTIYGYAVVDNATSKILKLQKEVSASTLSTSSDSYRVTDSFVSDSAFTREGNLRLLDMLRGGVGFGDVRIKLIREDFEVSSALVYSDLKFANFSGYADATPSYGSATLVGTAGTTVDSQRTFTHDGGEVANIIYGYAVVDTSISRILKVQRQDTPTSMATNGDFFKVTDKLTAITI